MNEPIILGIESSCDDTSAAIINGNKILSNIAANQTVHQEYGGVVPELASRAHQQNIIPVVEKSFTKANTQQKDISAIGFTRGPGLLGSLLVGTSFAKSLAMSLDVPLIEVNHLQAHILCHFIEDANPMPPKFPFLCLTVSGGHTMIVLVKDYFDMEIIGKTIDDAAGEAFDKIGKIMGLDYPAGPIIDKLAKLGNPDAFTFGKYNPMDKTMSYVSNYANFSRWESTPKQEQPTTPKNDGNSNNLEDNIHSMDTNDENEEEIENESFEKLLRYNLKLIK